MKRPKMRQFIRILLLQFFAAILGFYDFALALPMHVFVRNPTLKSFEQLNEDDRIGSLSEIIAKEFKNLPESERQKIIDKYVEKASPDERDNYYGGALWIALSENRTEILSEIFEKGTRGNLESAQSYICNTLQEMALVATEKRVSNTVLNLSEKGKMMRALAPVIMQQPKLADETCEIGDDGRIMTIREIAAMADPHLDTELNPRARKVAAPIKAPVMSDSMCTAAQAKSYLSDAFIDVVVNKTEKHGIATIEGKCRITGVMKRTKDGFVLIKNPRSPSEITIKVVGIDPNTKKEFTNREKLNQLVEDFMKSEKVAELRKEAPSVANSSNDPGHAFVLPLSNSKAMFGTSR